MPDNTEYLLPAIIKIIKTAGNIILDFYQSDYSIKEKSDKTKITDADLMSDKIIVQQLRVLTPDIPILSEEASKIAQTTRMQWHIYWLIDPLDGTREFIDKNDEFSINIALIKNNKPILGVIYAPCKELLFYASQNNGAWRIRHNETPQQIHTRKVGKKLTIIAGNHSVGSPYLKQFINNFQNTELLVMGSSLKSCLVAAGEVDVYPCFGPTSEWDTAAAQCIVEEAGGLIIDLTMQPLLYNKKDLLLNPQFLVIGDLDFDWEQIH